MPSVAIRQGPRGTGPVPKKYNLLQTYSLEVVTLVQLGRLLKRYKNVDLVINENPLIKLLFFSVHSAPQLLPLL